MKGSVHSGKMQNIKLYKNFKRKKERKKITVYQTEGKGQTDGQKEVY